MTKQFLVVIIAFACSSCSSNRKSVSGNIPERDTFLPPKVTILANLPDSLQPTSWVLDTLPKPRVVNIPARSGGFYRIPKANGGVSKIKLEPPVRKSLAVLLDAQGNTVKDSSGKPLIMGGGGLSHFTNFTTDDGLTLDAIDCSLKDKTGNLWLGTNGGGVSRYDGKSFVTFSTAQGLAENSVWSIVEDKEGNLWFGTYGGGVSRFDGRSFVTFSTDQGLPNNNVKSIAQDRYGNLWFGTDGGGVCRYDGKRIVTYSAAHGLANNKVRCIAEDDEGNMWFGTDGGGVTRFDGNKGAANNTEENIRSSSFVTFTTQQGLAGNSVWCITKDRKGRLWFGTKGGGVSCYNPSEKSVSGPNIFKNFTTAHGLADNNVLCITEEKTARTGEVVLWFGTNSGGVSRYDGKSFVTFSTAQGLANNRVMSITQDKTAAQGQGAMWFGTDGGGLSRYNGNSFVTYSTAHGLAGSTVLTIAEDDTGNIWFGTQVGGVSRYDGKSFVTFSIDQGLGANNVFCITKDRAGDLWLGTEGGGVSRYNGRSLVTFSTPQRLAGSIWSIAEDKRGDIWFGTQGGGVTRYTRRSQSVLQADNTTLKPTSESFVTFSTTQGLANNFVLSIIEDKAQNLWFGTQGGGTSRYDGKTLVTFSTAQGLANNNVWCQMQDKAGNLWFGTSEGLCVMSAKEVEKIDTFTQTITNAGGKIAEQGSGAIRGRQLFITFTKTDGLPDNFVTQVAQLPNGKIAVGTNLGITLFKPTEDLTKLNNIEIYNSTTGYPLKDINTGPHAMFLDSKGIIWAGTGSEKTAVVRFDPSALPKSNEEPTLRISSIKVNEEAICWNDLYKKSRPENRTPEHTEKTATPAYVTEEVTIIGKALTEMEREKMRHKFEGIQFDSIRTFYPVPENLILPYRHNHITIEFVAVETEKPNLVNYQYMLVGYDNDWSPVTKNTNATFGNIHEGNYTFKVKAQGPNGVWSVPVTYTFRVLPPWYRTWLAFGIYCILFLLALRIFSKWRERKLRMEKAHLERTVEQRTEELVQKNMVVESQKAAVEKEKQRSDELLLNILPGEVADELKANGTSAAKLFDNVTVLFTDFVGFSTASERMTPQELVNELHACFQAFDGIMGRYNIEKIKTVGDAYLAVCGLPQPAPYHAENVIKAALEIREFMAQRYAQLGSKTFQIRIGVHSGSLVAGIVGIKKFAYDVWGDTVNTAARMEQNSEPGKINISEATYTLVKNMFSCVYRGEIAAKNKGMLKMYFVS